MNRQQANRIRARLEAALLTVAAECDVDVKLSGGTFNDVSFRPRVEFFDRGGEDKREQERFRREAPLYGLDPDDLGREFVFLKGKAVVVGLAKRPGRLPVLARFESKVYRFDVPTVMRGLHPDRVCPNCHRPTHGGLNRLSCLCRPSEKVAAATAARRSEEVNRG